MAITPYSQFDLRSCELWHTTADLACPNLIIQFDWIYSEGIDGLRLGTSWANWACTVSYWDDLNAGGSCGTQP